MTGILTYSLGHFNDEIKFWKPFEIKQNKIFILMVSSQALGWVLCHNCITGSLQFQKQQLFSFCPGFGNNGNQFIIADEKIFKIKTLISL